MRSDISRNCAMSPSGTFRTWRPGCLTSVYWGRAEIALTCDNVRVRPFSSPAATRLFAADVSAATALAL